MLLRRSTISLCQRLGGLSEVSNEKLCSRAQGSFFQRYDVRRSSRRGEFHGQDLELGKRCTEMERRFLNYGEKSPGRQQSVAYTPWRCRGGLPAEPHIRLRGTHWPRSTSRDVLARAASNFRRQDLRVRPAVAESMDYRPPRRSPFDLRTASLR